MGALDLADGGENGSRQAGAACGGLAVEIQIAGRPPPSGRLVAALAQVDHLCASGAGRGGQSLYDAVYAYNHAHWYVRDVLALAQAYARQYS